MAVSINPGINAKPAGLNGGSAKRRRGSTALPGPKFDFGRVTLPRHRQTGRSALPYQRRRDRVCLKIISRRRGELHETPFLEAFPESGARVTRPSETVEMVSAAPSAPRSAAQ
jgi:hypothetical protein